MSADCRRCCYKRECAEDLQAKDECIENDGSMFEEDEYIFDEEEEY